MRMRSVLGRKKRFWICFEGGGSGVELEVAFDMLWQVLMMNLIVAIAPFL
jgi:hypothetical protein